MKLFDACRLAQDCGMDTIGEAINNIEELSLFLFSNREAPEEILQIYEDPLWQELNITVDNNINQVLEKYGN